MIYIFKIYIFTKEKINNNENCIVIQNFNYFSKIVKKNVLVNIINIKLKIFYLYLLIFIIDGSYILN